MKNKKKIYFIPLCIFSLLSTLLSTMDSSLKVIPIACTYILLYRYYKIYHHSVKIYGWSKSLLLLYVFYCIFLVLRSMFYDSNSGIMGNYVLSLFGNLEFGILSWAMPVCILLIFEDNFLLSYCKICDILVVLGIFLGCLYLCGIDSSLFCKIFYLVPIICPRLVLFKQKRMLYFAYIIISLLYCYLEDERSLLAMHFICIAGLIFYMFFKKNKRILNLLKIYICVVPILGVTLTIVNLVTGDSIFTIMENTYGNKSSMVQDSRTFLFRELNDDLTATSSWIYGKGIFGTYYSQVMHNALMRKDYSDNENRLGTEAGYLWLLLKGGVIYSILYVLLFYIAILKGIKSKNVFLFFLAFIIANRLLLMFVSFTPTYDIINMFLWIFLGMCYQPHVIDKYIKS